MERRQLRILRGQRDEALVSSISDLHYVRVKIPAMARCTLKMVQIASNFLNARQAEAVRGEPVLVGEIGLKGNLDFVSTSRTSFVEMVCRLRLLAAALVDFEARLCERILPIRPDQEEPRAVKTRPKPCQLLNKPRREFTETRHRSHYRNAAQSGVIRD